MRRRGAPHHHSCVNVFRYTWCLLLRSSSSVRSICDTLLAEVSLIIAVALYSAVFVLYVQDHIKSCGDAPRFMEIRFVIEPCRRELLGCPVARYSAAFVNRREFSDDAQKKLLSCFRLVVQNLVESYVDAPTFMEIRFAIEPYRRELLVCPVARYSAAFVL